jgi:hypothetical protein
MAHFIRTQTGGGTYWVNVETIRFMEPIKSGTILRFDKEHSLAVDNGLGELLNEVREKSGFRST